MIEADFNNFTYEDISIYYLDGCPLDHPTAVCQWLYGVIASHGYKTLALNYIFCTDVQLLKINQEHLNHDTYTDIITFDYSENPKELESDIYISMDRVKDNAPSFGKSFADELHRVMVHGVLHLIGYTDKSEEEKKIMREKENTCLSLREF